MSQYSSIKLTEIFIQIRSTNITLENYEEYALQINSVISKPSQNLNIKRVTSFHVISSGAYYVSNDIIVEEGAELVVEPGVFLYFAQGKGIVSYGKLSLNGTPENLIFITGDKWANISILTESSNNSQIVNTIIEGGQSRSAVPTYGETFRSWNDSLLGGNLYIEKSHLIMKDCIILNGYAEFGGGLFIYESSVDIDNITVFNNSAKTTAGGLELTRLRYDRSSSGPSIIKNSYILKNSGFQCGGVYVREGNVTLNNLSITNNASSHLCGGILINKINRYDLSDIRLINSTVQENTGDICGGLYCDNYEPKSEDIITNLIRNNSTRSGETPNFLQSLNG